MSNVMLHIPLTITFAQQDIYHFKALKFLYISLHITDLLYNFLNF